MTNPGWYPREPRIRWDYAGINDLLLWGTRCGMSDLCLRSALPAWMRLNGTWRMVTQRAITTDELLSALERLTRNNSVAALIKSGQSDYDFAHEIEESRGVRRRYRGNATPVADGYSTGVKIVFRAIPSMPPGPGRPACGTGNSGPCHAVQRSGSGHWRHGKWKKHAARRHSSTHH